jgi:organic hydroperoxide reductase OsmC/OhrA
MLWFLALAAKAGLVVDRYADAAVGTMGPNERGQVAILSATLHPEVVFSGPTAPSREQFEALHHDAHERCNVANSVNFPVHVLGTFVHTS